MRLKGKDIWPMLKQTWAEFTEDKAQTLAAALAIYTMISIAPLLVITTKVVGVMTRGDKQAQEKVVSTMQGVVPGMEPGQIQTMIDKAGQHGEGTLATVISTILVIVGATGVFGQLQDSMNTIWEVKPKPRSGIWGFIRTRFLSMAMVLGIVFLFMVSTLGTALVTAFGTRIAGGAGVIAAVLSHLVSVVVMWGLFVLIFKLLPDAKTAWKDVLLGAAITAVLFELGKVALGLYLKGSSTQVFGAAGSLAALLLFVFYSAQIMFLGAEFTQIYARKYGQGIHPTEDAVKVTEEDRAQQGRPHEGRVAAKAAQQGKAGPGAAARPAAAGTGGRPGSPARQYTAPQIPAYSFVPSGDGGRATQYVLAGAGVVVGAIAGALGAKSLLNDPSRPTRKHLQAVRLEQRLGNIEQKVGRASRIREFLEEAAVAERVRKVEKQIRHARTALRAEASHRPHWLVRLGEMIAGNR